MTDALVSLNLASTLGLAGLIWFVQIVHYPLFARVGGESFAGYEREHVRRTSWVVAPLMLVELVTSVWMCLALPASSRGLAFGGLGLLLVIWWSTFRLQVPCHRRLEQGFDPAAVRRLVSTNWIRTIAWSVRVAVLGWIVAQRSPA